MCPRGNCQGSAHGAGIDMFRFQEEVMGRQVKGFAQSLTHPVNFHDPASQEHRRRNWITLDHVGLVISGHGMDQAQENVRNFGPVLLEVNHVGFGEH